MSLRNLLFSSQGRVSRSTFWKHIIGIQILILVAILPLVVRSLMAESGNNISETFETILVLYSLIVLPIIMFITFIADISVGIRRCHDRNKLGGFILLSFIPIINIWVLIELGFLRGTVGENQYGPDPINDTDASTTLKQSLPRQ